MHSSHRLHEHLREGLPVKIDDSLSSKATNDLVRAAIDELPSPQAEALVMRVVFGYSVEEIAAEANAPVNTVRSRLLLAKAALRRRLGNPNEKDRP